MAFPHTSCHNFFLPYGSSGNNIPSRINDVSTSSGDDVIGEEDRRGGFIRFLSS